MSTSDRSRRTQAYHNAALRWIHDRRAPDHHHPQLDEFVSAFDSGAPPGFGGRLYSELQSAGWIEKNEFGALRLTVEGKSARERGIEDDYAI